MGYTYNKYRRDKDSGTRQRAGRRQRSFQMLEPRIMLAADLPVDLLTGPDDPVAQVAQIETVAPADQPIRDLPAPTATDVDALFEADFDQQPGAFVEPGDSLDSHVPQTTTLPRSNNLFPTITSWSIAIPSPVISPTRLPIFSWPATRLTGRSCPNRPPNSRPTQSGCRFFQYGPVGQPDSRPAYCDRCPKQLRLIELF